LIEWGIDHDVRLAADLDINCLVRRLDRSELVFAK
jgi:hypothetical protein